MAPVDGLVHRQMAPGTCDGGRARDSALATASSVALHLLALWDGRKPPVTDHG
jgi:hypothetical protein